MTHQVLDDDHQPMDAHAEVDSRGITFHSRGGSAERGAQNADYGPALRLLLRRLAVAAIPIEGAWVDSGRVQAIPIADRTILFGHEIGSQAFTLMSNRMREVGQGTLQKGGNSTKRIRIQFAASVPIQELEEKLGVARVAKDLRSRDRLPAEELERVTAEHVWHAVEKLREGGREHRFGASTDFDLVTAAGERFPPKAVFGLAASEVLGFEVQPSHFSGGIGTACFRILQRAGFTIVRKNEAVPAISIPASQEDREWTEGKPKLMAHLERERAWGLPQAKKDYFIRLHGRLRCERCGMDPVEVYGDPHGLACIEVHHHTVQVAEMAEAQGTRLEDLQCLCANGHRVVHSELRETEDPISTNTKAARGARQHRRPR
jgi:5-methylcytosine-specific restriction protein A